MGRLPRLLIPMAIACVLGAMSPPEGLPPHAWRYFAIFVGVVAGLALEPLPSAAIGLVAVTIITLLGPWVLFGPADFAQPGFDAPTRAIGWALSGFSNATVWLAFGAFMFALGYERTGLGRRLALMLVRVMGHRTLSLGVAVALADLILAPVTPSNTARSAGAVFPIVRNLPPLYGSLPNDPSARRIGGYLMWTSFATGCVTSSLFLTACAPNLLALELLRRVAQVEVSWMQWFLAAAPFAVPLLVALPILTYLIYPPEIGRGSEAPSWAAAELTKMGPFSAREVTLSLLVLLAISLWIFGGRNIHATAAALIVIALMLATGVVTWREMASYGEAWTTLTVLATLVTLSDGLSRTGFIAWFSGAVSVPIAALPPSVAAFALVGIYFFSHYLFASLTAHTTAMMPAMIAIAVNIPGLEIERIGLLLAMTTGIMGVITPYATGPAPAFYGSGYIPSGDFWRLGTIFGLIFLGALLLLGAPPLLWWR